MDDQAESDAAARPFAVGAEQYRDRATEQATRENQKGEPVTQPDRNVVITGNAGGIGSTLADCLLANDDTVVATLESLRSGRDAAARIITASAAAPALIVTSS